MAAHPPRLVLRACLLASSSSPCSCRGREPRSPAVRGVSTPGCSRREGEVPEREVRAGRQGRRRRAGRVAEPRRDAGLRRGGHCGADHWQRRASECGIDRAAADAGAGAHRRGRRPHGFPHLPIRNAGLMDELTELPALS